MVSTILPQAKDADAENYNVAALARKLVALEAAHVRVALEPPDQVTLGHIDVPNFAE
jgi:carotenoid cleavage dioxygenase-like enzyme